jgi:hypothetical protein
MDIHVEASEKGTFGMWTQTFAYGADHRSVAGQIRGVVEGEGGVHEEGQRREA